MTVSERAAPVARSAQPRSAPAKGEAMTTVVDRHEMKTLVGEIVNRRPAVGLAVGVIRNGRLDVPPETIHTDVPQHPEIWGDICGWYSVPSRFSDMRLREMAGAGVEVFVRGGRLMLRVLTPIPAAYRGFPLHPDD